MAYEWPEEQCSPQIRNERYPKGVPYSKLAIVTLEKGGELHKFRTQEQVDVAWKDGWHEPGKPETADVPRETEDAPIHRYEVEAEANPAPRKRGGWPKGKPRGPRRKKVE